MVTFLLSIAVAVALAGAVVRLIRFIREKDDLVALLDSDPEFQKLDEAEKINVLRGVLRVTHRRQRSAVIRAFGFAIIISLVMVLALWGEQALNMRQIHEARARADAVAHVAAVDRYRFCVYVNDRVVDPLRGGIATLTKPASTRGVTDRQTLARIVQSNAEKAAAAAILDAGLIDFPCLNPDRLGT